MYEFPEELVLAAYSDYITQHFIDDPDEIKMEHLSDLCIDGLADPILESEIVIDYLDKHYEKFLKNLDFKFY